MMNRIGSGYSIISSISPRLKRLLPNVLAREQIVSLSLQGIPRRETACNVVARCIKAAVETSLSNSSLILNETQHIAVHELMLNMAMHGRGGEFIINRISIKGSWAFDEKIVETCALDNGIGIINDINSLLARSMKVHKKLGEEDCSPAIRTNIGFANIFRNSDQMEVETCGARWFKIPDNKFQKLRGRVTEGSYFRLLFFLGKPANFHVGSGEIL
jgi:hypothetical protein